jgi:molybdate transport system substrate-binding protein
MNAWSKIAGIALAGCMSVLGTANAAEINVVSTAGPMPEVLGKTLLPAFEKASGTQFKVAFKSAPAIVKDINGGAAIDLIVSEPEAMADLVKEGKIAPDAMSRVMLSRVGLAVKAGAPKPDISTPEALKAALIAAKSVGYSQGASGQHFVTVIQRLGLTDVLKPKTVVVQGKPVGAAVAAGEAEIGIQQVAELLPVPGIDFVGPLPGDLQKIIVYSAAVPAKAKEADAARAFVKFLGSEAAMSIYKPKGMQPPG